MTRFLATLLTMVVWVGLVDDAVARKSHFGLKGGVNMARLNGGDANELDSRNGFEGGVFYGVEFTDDFAVQLEGLYVQKGAEGPYPTEDGDIHDTAFALDYIEFPVLFNAALSDSKKIGFNLYAGPTFGFNVDAVADVEEHGEEELDAESFEFGAAFGGGVEYLLSSMSIVGDVRYSIGATEAVTDSDIKNSGIAITLGVEFPIGEN
jgi:hypothetical protein